MNSAAESLEAEEFIRRLITLVRQDSDALSPGLPLKKIEEYFIEYFKCSCVETVNRMLEKGSLVGARPKDREHPRMQRPELVKTVTSEEVVMGKYPMFYLPDKLSNAVKPLWRKESLKRKILLEILTDQSAPLKGGGNVIDLQSFHKN
jgi:hypothetical protein